MIGIIVMTGVLEVTPFKNTCYRSDGRQYDNQDHPLKVHHAIADHAAADLPISKPHVANQDHPLQIHHAIADNAATDHPISKPRAAKLVRRDRKITPAPSPPPKTEPPVAELPVAAPPVAYLSS